MIGVLLDGLRTGVDGAVIVGLAFGLGVVCWLCLGCCYLVGLMWLGLRVALIVLVNCSYCAWFWVCFGLLRLVTLLVCWL